jgi:hypothetical protein
VLPAIISLRHDDGARYAIAIGALVVLVIAIAYSKRKGGSFAEESDVVAEVLEEHGLPAGASAGE